MTNISPRERAAVLQSLAAGVVPAIGLHLIQVGRKEEVEALIQDLKRVEEGSAAVRFVAGRYGSGKTFFLNLIRNVALQRKFVVVQADITNDRRLYGSGGEARALFSELTRNLATRAKPEGGALKHLVERWIDEIDHEIRSGGGTVDDVRKQITERLHALQDLVSGFDFAKVLTAYYDGYQSHNEPLQDQALRWLRAEFRTKTEAREALGVRTIIDDATFYDYLKLLAAFVRLAGYAGLLINVDELVVISHRIANSLTRAKNYEAILQILNDCLQGRAQGLVFLFAGTDECVQDRRRGLFSYEALATRLAPSRFATEGRKDWSAPVVALENLSPEDCYVLLTNLRNVHSSGDATKYRIPNDGIEVYLKDCNQRMGSAYFQTPRDTVKDFVNFLNMLEQNPQMNWQELLGSAAFAAARAPTETQTTSNQPGGELSSFTL